MANTNVHGLSRTIPESVKREVRQRCGFGCVICGLAFYDYEHFDPEFCDAFEHNPDGMTLLCSQCNQKKARGRLSAETVARANANPKCLQQGFAQEIFDFGIEPIIVKFAGSQFIDCRHIVVVNGLPLLSIRNPEKAGMPILVSGFFTDANGQITLSIRDNEFYVGADNWDVQCVGPLITLRNGLGEVSLVIRLHTPTGLSIEKLEMKYQGVWLRGTTDTLEFSFTNGDRWSSVSNGSFYECESGIVLGSGRSCANDPIYDPCNPF